MTALARELLARTGELPASKHGLFALLTEYRHALHALAYPTARQDDDQHHQLTAVPHTPDATRRRRNEPHRRRNNRPP